MNNPGQTAGAMDEFELIARYFTRRSSRDDVRLGIGDDGAIIDVPAGRSLVSVLDTLVDGVHYPVDLAPQDIGYRAVAVNLSDIAAMGAVPAWMLLGLTLPSADPDWLQGFAAGLYEAADEHGVSLVGGDTTRGTQTVITVQLSGHVDPNAWLARGGARAGDLIFVSGTLGDAAGGLEILKDAAKQDNKELVGRFRRPAPRVALGQALATLASAAIDVSDGLLADLGHVLHASGKGAAIDFQALPLSSELLRYYGRERAVSFALGGGDDYELCFTVPPGKQAALYECASALDVAVTRIGMVDDGDELRCTDNGVPVTLDPVGFQHFAA
ncbi:MAG: thiamine-phosphate kinase, partial [Woeseia sp.]